LQPEAGVIAASGKLLTDPQPALFAELDEDKWRSSASVLPKVPQHSSLGR
jgi:hypothetical protein